MCVTLPHISKCLFRLARGIGSTRSTLSLSLSLSLWLARPRHKRVVFSLNQLAVDF
ncbi:hypothetical protein Mapa_015263 [Marchantia paleacea]|nr:hypothetical protein Mapa_015263 [Marchantia paleacea]